MKARRKKPAKSSAVEWLIRFGLPLLRATTNEETLIAARAVYESQGVKIEERGWQKWFRELTQEGIYMELFDSPLLVATLMVREATKGEKLNNQREKRRRKDLAHTVMDYFQPYLVWSDNEKKFGLRPRKRHKDEHFLDYFEGVVKAALLVKVVEAFECQPGMPSVGSYYIGFCASCVGVFFKRRLNQEYCNRACADRQAHRLQRKREAESIRQSKIIASSIFST